MPATVKNIVDLSTDTVATIFPNPFGLIDAAVHQQLMLDILASSVNRVTDLQLLNLREFSATRQYTVGECTVFGIIIYKCTTAHLGVWNPANFSVVGTPNDLSATLAVGNNVGGQDITSTDGMASLSLNDTGVAVLYSNAFSAAAPRLTMDFNTMSATLASTHGAYTFDPTRMLMIHTMEIEFNSPLYTYSTLTADTVPFINGSNNFVSSSVTSAELGRLSGVVSPIQAQIDALSTGQTWKKAVRMATTANIILSGLQTIDTVVGAVDDRVLVKDQVTLSDNGVYLMKAGAWVRTTDFDSGADNISGGTVTVNEGTQAESKWTCTTDEPVVVGVSNLVFVNIGGTTYVGTTNRLTITGNILDISPLYVGQATITTLGTVTTGVWNAGAVTSSSSVTASTSVVTPILDSVAALAINRAGVSRITFGATTTVFTTADAVFAGVGIRGGSTGLKIKVPTSPSLASAELGINGGRIRTEVGTITDGSGAGARTLMIADSFLSPIFASTNAITVADAYTAYIDAPPTIAASITATNVWAFGVGSGRSKFGGEIHGASYVKLGGATVNAYLSAYQNDTSVGGVTTWVNLFEDGRDAYKDFFIIASNKTTASSGGATMTMKSRGTGTTTFQMLNDGANWLTIGAVDGVAGFSSASTRITIDKSFAPNADSTIDLGTVTRSWRTLFVGTGGGANGTINQLGNAVGSGTNFPILLGNSRDDGLANKSAMIIRGNLDYTTTHYLSVRGGVTDSVLFTIAPLGKIGIGLGGTTELAASPTAYVDIVGGTLLNAPLRLRAGVLATSPNLGDITYDGANFFVRATTRNDQIARVLTGSATLDFPNTVGGSSSELTLTVVGASVGDCVAIGLPSGINPNSTFIGRVTAVDTVTIRFCNFSGLPINPVSATYKVVVFKNI